MRYGSVCSGIEAAALAVKQAGVGWKCAFLSEIEKFPCAILKHHYPDTPLHGDFTTIGENDYGPIRLICGGTPCQSFSIAGKRRGLDDPRGDLSLEFIKLAERKHAVWLVFENVPGLLSSADGEDFATFISAATGYEYAAPEGGWKKAGIAEGKPGKWGISWRMLDAQYFGVAQRRRRVIVIGYLGNWRPAAAVLCEPESVPGNPAPRREKGHKIASTIGNGSGNRGWKVGAEEAAGNRLITSTGRVSHCLNGGGMGRIDYETETLVSLTPGNKGMSVDQACGNMAIARTLKSGGNLRHDESQDTLIAFSHKDYGNGATENLSPTLQDQHNGMAVAIHENQRGEISLNDTTPLNTDGGKPGQGYPAIAVFKAGQGSAAGGIGYEVEKSPTLGAADSGSNRTPCIQNGMTVRRLTEKECERLQGFPDDYTQIPWRNKPAEACPGGPRYKSIGNSWAVPKFAWLFKRIDFVDKLLEAEHNGDKQ